MEGPISFWGYKEQESNLILPEHDDDDHHHFDNHHLIIPNSEYVKKGFHLWRKLITGKQIITNMHFNQVAEFAVI